MSHKVKHFKALHKKTEKKKKTKHTEMSEQKQNNHNLGACACVTQCLCVLHTYNIKRHLPGPEAILALLPSLLLLLCFIFLLCLSSLLSRTVLAGKQSCVHL